MKNFKDFKEFWGSIHQPYVYKYDKIDSEMVEQCISESFSGEMENQWIKDFKQIMIDAVLMGNDKKEIKMNRVELEVKRLRERTGDNYMLNKMVNTDGVEFFAEYTLYKDYDKYFGLTLSGTSIDIVDIIEEEFAEFLYHYTLSTIYPQVEAVHEDTWDITPEENEAIKEQMESGETDKFTPMYDENDIDKQLVVDSKYDMSINSFSESHLKGPEMWTETSTNTGKGCEESWTETSTNTGENYAGPWGGCYSSGSGTIPVASGSSTILVTPEAFYIDEKQLKGLSTTQHLKNTQDGHILINNTENKSDKEKLEESIKKLEESIKIIKSLLAQEEQVETKDSPNTLKNIEHESRAELTTKIISDIIEELLTKGTYSLNISLKQD